MLKPKTDKLLKGVLSSSVALMGLSACSPAMQEELFSVPAEEPETQPDVQPPADGPPSPEEADCDTWTWDEEAEGYQCAEEDNQRYGHYYYGGSWFPTIAAFMAGRAMAGGNNRTTTPPRTDQNATTPRTDQNTTQPKPSTSPDQQKAPNRTSQPRSGMGGGGVFGG